MPLRTCFGLLRDLITLKEATPQRDSGHSQLVKTNHHCLREVQGCQPGLGVDLERRLQEAGKLIQEMVLAAPAASRRSRQKTALRPSLFVLGPRITACTCAATSGASTSSIAKSESVLSQALPILAARRPTRLSDGPVSAGNHTMPKTALLGRLAS